MKKIVSLVLCILMLLTFFTVTAAADGDAEVSYALKIEASAPKKGETYSVGETVTLKVAVSTKDAMGNTNVSIGGAPIYGFNGALNYDSLLLELTDTSIPESFRGMICQDSAPKGRITFSFLCSTSGSSLSGVDVDADFVLVQFKFKTLRDGVSVTTLSDVVITDKNAGARPIISSTSKIDLSIGTGETVSDEQSLAKSIENAKEQLDSAIMNPTGELVYPAFTVSQEAYDALDAAIKAAEKALGKATLPDEFLEAERALLDAISVYEDAKSYGKNQGDISGIIGGLISGEKVLIEVTAAAGEHGKISEGYDSQLVRYGTSATVIAVPDEGYEVEKVKVNGVEYQADETVTIASVRAKTHIEFSFKKATGTSQTPDNPQTSDTPENQEKSRFTDVLPGTWYFDAVEKIVEMGLFAGTSATEFSPNMPMTRAMLVTVLYRLEGKPSVIADVTFKDVGAGEWYTDAIAWASVNGIVSGYSADKFGTNDSISRQDMVTIFYRYLKYKGLTPAEGASLDLYTDADKLSDYAKPAMEWANATGLVKGTSDTTLSPKDNCTRAQVATIVLRYTENIAVN